MWFLLVLLFLVGCGTPGPFLYVANEGDGTISVIDQAALKVIDTIHLAGMPHNVNIDPLGRYIYATNHEDDREETHTMNHEGETPHTPYLRVFNASSHALVTSVAMEHMAAHVVPSRDGQKVYVSREGEHSMVEVDPAEWLISRVFPVGEGPHGFVVSNDGKRLFVPNMKSNDFSVVDLTSGNSERFPISFDNYHCEIPVAMGADDKFVYVTCASSFDIYKIDTLHMKAVGRVSLPKGDPPGPIQIPVAPDNQHLYVPDMRHGVVHKINLETFVLEKDIPSGSGAHGIAYAPDGKTAYVTNTWEDTVSIIDLVEERLVRKIPAGKAPNGIAVVGGKNQGW